MGWKYWLWMSLSIMETLDNLKLFVTEAIGL